MISELCLVAWMEIKNDLRTTSNTSNTGHRKQGGTIYTAAACHTWGGRRDDKDPHSRPLFAPPLSALNLI